MWIEYILYIKCFYIALTHQNKLINFKYKLCKILLIFKSFKSVQYNLSWNDLKIQVDCTKKIRLQLFYSDIDNNL